jgi:hypothetical protein
MRGKDLAQITVRHGPEVRRRERLGVAKRDLDAAVCNLG